MANQPRIAVEAMLDSHAPFERIEDFIEALDLEPDAKSALWLLAWAETEPAHRRRAVDQLLAAVV